MSVESHDVISYANLDIIYFIQYSNPSFGQAWKLSCNYTPVIKCSPYVVSAFVQVT